MKYIDLRELERKREQRDHDKFVRGILGLSQVGFYYPTFGVPKLIYSDKEGNRYVRIKFGHYKKLSAGTCTG